LAARTMPAAHAAAAASAAHSAAASAATATLADVLRQLSGLEADADGLAGLRLDRVRMVGRPRERDLQLVLERSLLGAERDVQTLQVIPHQAPRIVFCRTEDVDAIVRRTGVLGGFPLGASAAAALTAAEDAALDHRIADAELLLGTAGRIEPYRHAETGDLHARAGVGCAE